MFCSKYYEECNVGETLTSKNLNLVKGLTGSQVIMAQGRIW